MYYQAHRVSEIAENLGLSDSTYLRKQECKASVDKISGKQHLSGGVFSLILCDNCCRNSVLQLLIWEELYEPRKKHSIFEERKADYTGTARGDDVGVPPDNIQVGSGCVT